MLGRLGDIFGKEHMLVAVLGIFALGSLVAALSHSIEMLVGRASDSGRRWRHLPARITGRLDGRLVRLRTPAR
jgi:MFS family permease